MTGAERVAKRRAALRAQGLRPRTIWVPDRNSPEFKAQAARDVETLNAWYDANPAILAELEEMQVLLPNEPD